MVNLEAVIGNLIDLIESKHGYLKEIHLLTKQQTDAIENSDMSFLSLLIDEKQERIDFIRNIDAKFETITDDLKTVFGVKSLDELEVHCDDVLRLKESISSMMELLRQIVDLEADNREKIYRARDLLEVKMSNAKNGKRAIKQYGGVSGYTDSYFFDKKIK